MPVKVEIKETGIKEIVDKLNYISHNIGTVTDDAMKKSTLTVERSAKIHVPVDLGLLRKSITSSVTSSISSTEGIVGSNVKYANDVEVGTKPHYVPPEQLEGWARRHGTMSYIVSRAIRKRGTKGKFYFQKAIKNRTPFIIKYFKESIIRLLSS